MRYFITSCIVVASLMLTSSHVSAVVLDLNSTPPSAKENPGWFKTYIKAVKSAFVTTILPHQPRSNTFVTTITELSYYLLPFRVSDSSKVVSLGDRLYGKVVEAEDVSTPMSPAKPKSKAISPIAPGAVESEDSTTLIEGASSLPSSPSEPVPSDSSPTTSSGSTSNPVAPSNTPIIISPTPKGVDAPNDPVRQSDTSTPNDSAVTPEDEADVTPVTEEIDVPVDSGETEPPSASVESPASESSDGVNPSSSSQLLEPEVFSLQGLLQRSTTSPGQDTAPYSKVLPSECNKKEQWC